MKPSFIKHITLALLCSTLLLQQAHAQTEHDAIMMNKHQWCNGFSFMQSKWDNYWEGTLKRDNLNIGTFTSNSVMFMTNYGITDKLNIMAGLPYVSNNVSAGTLHKMHGLQDVSVNLKYKALTYKWGKQKFSLLGNAGVTVPLTNYIADYLPIAIGMGSTTLTGRGIADYQYGKFFVTASAAYTLRSNTKTDRSAYYTDHMVFSHDIDMPDVFSYMASAGLRSKFLIAEAMFSNMITQGGFDIRRNDMPFPANRMNMTTVGAHVKYTLPFYSHIELTADGSYVVHGRNVGQATNWGIGAFYIFTFNSHKNTPVNLN